MVSEREILEAMKMVWEELKVVCEASCAVTLAAVARYAAVFAGRRVVCVLTGGNGDWGEFWAGV